VRHAPFLLLALSLAPASVMAVEGDPSPVAARVEAPRPVVARPVEPARMHEAIEGLERLRLNPARDSIERPQMALRPQPIDRR